MLPRTKALVREFRSSVARIGTVDTCLYVASRVLDACFRGRIRIVKYYFMAQPVAEGSATRGARSGSFVLTFIDGNSPLFAQIERPPEVIAQRFAQGARCLAATTDDATLAGFLWFVVGPYEEDEVRARFDPMPSGRSAWDFDVTILPRYRMGRLFSYLWDRAGSELSSQGVSHTLSRISAFNGPSIASHRRLGARVVGEALFLCLGRLQLMRASVAPRWHLSFRPESRPVLAIEA